MNPERCPRCGGPMRVVKTGRPVPLVEGVFRTRTRRCVSCLVECRTSSVEKISEVKDRCVQHVTPQNLQSDSTEVS